MQLLRLKLENFRQHADTVLEFRPGLTGIIGPNGSGKTTILEAIAWTIYGSPAARGTNDTLRFNRAPPRSSVRSELEFELGGARYRVLRTTRNAELYLGGGEAPIAAGVTEVTRQLTRRLGMDRDEFFNTYFTGQKELQFLAAMGPRERARFLSQVLGYEKLRAAQRRVRECRNALKSEVETLRQALGDPSEIEAAKTEAETRLADASSRLEGAERHEIEAAARLAEVEPRWSELQQARERDTELEANLRVARARLEAAEARQSEAESALKALDEVAAGLEGLRPQLNELASLELEDERLGKLAEAASRRLGLSEELERARRRTGSLSESLSEVETAASRLSELESRTDELRAGVERAESERDAARAEWVADAQDVKARLRLQRDQAKELERQIEGLEEAGSDGVCPTCRRPLGAEYGHVLEEVRGRYDEAVQDGRWLRSRAKQLESEPERVAGANRALAEARAAYEIGKVELAGAAAAAEQAEKLRVELQEAEKEARELAGKLAALPEGYSREEHDRLRERLRGLRELQRQATQLETRLEARPRLHSERASAAEEMEQIGGRIRKLEAEREKLAFSRERFEEVRLAFESAREDLQVARVTAEKTRGEVETARTLAESARQAEREYRERAQLLTDRRREHRLHNELDAALGQLREDLNARVRPELAEIASAFLAELTDGRYNEIAIDDAYEIVVLDDGEEKPVISGGEEDLANLVLRLAISQMIADRAGQALSLLVFDEVFGGLDDLRRESVIRLLQRLQDRFEQVILITHIESIREGMDQVARVTFDERTGASVVRDESPGATGEEISVEDLAVDLVTETSGS